MKLFKSIPLLILVFFISCNHDFKNESKPLAEENSKESIEGNSSILNDSISAVKQGFQLGDPNYFNNLLFDDRFKFSKSKIHKIDTISIKPYKAIVLTILDYSENARPNNYQGRGIIIIDESAKYNKYVWSYIDFKTDFPPHTFSFVDFNQDGKKDLFVYAGFEDVTTTKVFLNQVSSNRKKPFNLIFSNDNSYCALFDFNNDGIPELLNPIYKDDYNSLSAYDNPKSDHQNGDNTALLIDNEYDKVIGKFNTYNYDYKMPDHNKRISLKILNKVSILSFKNDTIVDVSTKYPDHYRFRIEALKSFKKVSAEMKLQIDSLIIESKKIIQN